MPRTSVPPSPPLPARGRGDPTPEGRFPAPNSEHRARPPHCRRRARSGDSGAHAGRPRRAARRGAPRGPHRRQADADLHRLPGDARHPARRRGGAGRGRHGRCTRGDRAVAALVHRPDHRGRPPQAEGVRHRAAQPGQPARARCSARKPWPARSAARRAPPRSPSSARPPARRCGAARPAPSPSTTSSASEPMRCAISTPLTIAEVKRETPDAISVRVRRSPRRCARRSASSPASISPCARCSTARSMRRNYSICSGPGDRACASPSSASTDGHFSNLGQRHAGSRRHARCHAAPGALRPAGRATAAPRHVVGIRGRRRHHADHGHGEAGAAARASTPASRSSTATARPTAILFREELEDLKDRYLGRFTLLHVLSRNEESSAPLFEGASRATR